MTLHCLNWNTLRQPARASINGGFKRVTSLAFGTCSLTDSAALFRAIQWFPSVVPLSLHFVNFAHEEAHSWLILDLSSGTENLNLGSAPTEVIDFLIEAIFPLPCKS
ncbi:hypothetical protein QCA50_015172 [Cerrena zonata]|uniref:Uncharacterized protein n=1 Tax=Cerrena zonata TaxID=2478898 RepID=A0AAW0FK73_9APHY